MKKVCTTDDIKVNTFFSHGINSTVGLFFGETFIYIFKFKVQEILARKWLSLFLTFTTEASLNTLFPLLQNRDGKAYFAGFS